MFELFEDASGEAGGLGCGDLGDGGEGPVDGVGSDLFNEVADGERFFGAGGARDVAGREGESIEQAGGAARVDVVGGDELDDLDDGGLEGGAVGGVWDLEVVGGSAGAAVLEGGGVDGFAGLVVVVAEVFSAEAWVVAAAAFGEFTAAYLALGLGLDPGSAGPAERAH